MNEIDKIDKIDKDKKERIAAMDDGEFAKVIRLAAAAMGLSPEMTAMAADNTDKIRGLLSGMSDGDIKEIFDKFGGGLQPK